MDNFRRSWKSLLRHTAATNLAKVTDLATLMEILGHTNPRTAKKYLNPARERKRAAIEAISPMVQVFAEKSAFHEATYLLTVEDDGWSVTIPKFNPNQAWWEVPLPQCPDCGGDMVWYEAGYVPGTRKCISCGSFFRVRVTANKESITIERARFYFCLFFSQRSYSFFSPFFLVFA